MKVAGVESAAKNIVLDFLDRANREIYHLYDNYRDDVHVDCLIEGLNVAAFLCGDYCVTPPGPIAECHLAREALLRREEYLSAQLIRFPLREKTIDEFLAKKRRTYGQHPAFAGLFEETASGFFKRFPKAFIPRSAQIGVSLAARLESGPDLDGIWKPMLPRLSAGQVEQVRGIGNRLLQEGLALTWKALSDHLPNKGIGLEFLRVALQHYYFSIYLEEYNATVLTGVPFATEDLLLSNRGFSYDFTSLADVLRGCRLWETVRKVSAESMLYIRSADGHTKFRSAFLSACAACSTREQFKARTRVPFAAVPPARTELFEKFSGLAPVPRGWTLDHRELEAMDWCLDAAADAIGNESGAGGSLIKSPHATPVILLNYGVVHIGDNFENVNQSIIAARHAIASGLIQIKTAGHPELSDALGRLEQAISAAADSEINEQHKKDALDLLSELTKQAASSSPATAVTKSLADGLWNKIKDVASVASTAVSVWPLIERLWQ